MKRQGVRGRDEESYLLTLACHMSDKKKPMRKEEVAKNKEITSTLLKHRHTSQFPKHHVLVHQFVTEP